MSFYNKVPGAQQVVELMRNPPAATSQGFRIANYERIGPVLNTQLTAAFDGKTPPVGALNN